MRQVSFELNGQTRQVLVKDKSFKITKAVHKKATATNEVGAPLQGKLSKILVKTGDSVKENAPLFIIEAMKMETVVSAPKAGKIKAITLTSGESVEQDDLVVEME
jgi:pyruvate carboxylase